MNKESFDTDFETVEPKQTVLMSSNSFKVVHEVTLIVIGFVCCSFLALKIPGYTTTIILTFLALFFSFYLIMDATEGSSDRVIGEETEAENKSSVKYVLPFKFVTNVCLFFFVLTLIVSPTVVSVLDPGFLLRAVEVLLWFIFIIVVLCLLAVN